LGFELVLAGLRQAGLVPRKGKQRLDSTHVLGLVSRMSWLERVRESLRLALEQIAEQVGSEQRPAFWSQLWERYVESQLDYQSPEETVKQKMKQAGEDILQLRAWLGKQPRAVQQLDQVQLLERIFAENFAVDPEGQFTVRQKSLPGAVQNPHDPEAEWCTKRTGEGKKEWVGYKMQVAETVPDQPVGKGELTHSFITSIVTQTATGSDEVGLEQTFQEQAEMGLDKPSELYTDGAYISGKLLAAAQAEGREVLGPAQPPAQTGSSVFKADAFQVDVEQRRAICPAGKENTGVQSLGRRKDPQGKLPFRVEHSLSRLPLVEPVCRRRSEASDLSSGRVSHRPTSTAAGNANGSFWEPDASTQRYRGNSQRIGAWACSAAGPLPRSEQSQTAELFHRCCLQRQTLAQAAGLADPTDRKRRGAVCPADQLKGQERLKRPEKRPF
jgi:hypothetical protein